MNIAPRRFGCLEGGFNDHRPPVRQSGTRDWSVHTTRRAEAAPPFERGDRAYLAILVIREFAPPVRRGAARKQSVAIEIYPIHGSCAYTLPPPWDDADRVGRVAAAQLMVAAPIIVYLKVFGSTGFAPLDVAFVVLPVLSAHRVGHLLADLARWPRGVDDRSPPMEEVPVTKSPVADSDASAAKNALRIALERAGMSWRLMRSRWRLFDRDKWLSNPDSKSQDRGEFSSEGINAYHDRAGGCPIGINGCRVRTQKTGIAVDSAE